MVRILLIAWAGAAVLVSGCQTVETTQAGVVGVDREQRMAVSAEEVNAGAVKAYAQMMAEAKKKGVLDRDPAMVKRVQDITRRLIPQTTAFRPDAAKWPWEVHVITLDEVNAWCMPAGKMAIYTGLIQKLNATDDEIAALSEAGASVVRLGPAVLRTSTAAAVALGALGALTQRWA